MSMEAIKADKEPTYNCILLNQTTVIKTINGKDQEYPNIPKGILCDRNGNVDPNNDPTNEINYDPNEEAQKFLLPDCRFLIVVTMYNEDSSLFHKTMLAIQKNLNKFVKENIPCNEIAVAVIVDGIKPFTEGLKDNQKGYYAPLFDIEAIYSYFNISPVEKEKQFSKLLDEKKKIPPKDSRDSLKRSVHHNVKAVELKNQCLNSLKDRYYQFAHCFTNVVSFDESLEHDLRVYFVVKHENKRKLNSHLWFFGGLCKVINPKFCMLVDVGTEPESEALYYLYHAMEKDAQVAGVCGEIIPRNERDSIFDILCYAQKVEYKFSHILDKALESLLGYITVLPGAFSGYRYESLMPDDENGPLWGEYFKSVRKPWLMDCYNANIYLAEDRVLCLALVSCEGHRNILKYVRRAIAYTDPPPDFESLLSQRRRWINGSWFALLDSVKNGKKIWMSEHNFFRKILFTLQMIYYMMNIVYSFVLVGGFYLALSICLRKQFDSESGRQSDVGTILLVFYLSMLIVVFIISVGCKIKDANHIFWLISVIFSGYMALFLVLLITLFFNNWQYMSVWLPVCSTVFGFFFLLLINNSLWTILLGSLQFLLATPTYINTFTIYAICNIHDCSWGNRPENMTQDEKDRMDDFEQFRTAWALLWVFVNCYFAYVLDAADESGTTYSTYIYVVGIVGMSILYMRFIGGFFHIIKQRCCKYCCLDKDREARDSENEEQKINR